MANAGREKRFRLRAATTAACVCVSGKVLYTAGSSGKFNRLVPDVLASSSSSLRLYAMLQQYRDDRVKSRACTRQLGGRAVERVVQVLHDLNEALRTGVRL